VLALVAAGGCGGDDEPSSPSKAPELTVPGATEDRDTQTETAPDTGTAAQPPASGAGGGAGGTGSSGGRRAPQDSPQNDIPPEPGSPEERFERFCDQNPGAC
jgi:hypothetical protein